MTLDDKPWYWGAGIGAVLAILVVVGVQYLLVQDIESRIHSDDVQITDLDQKIAEGRAAERKLPQFRDEVKRLEIELEKLRRILPSNRNTEEIIKKIKSLVDQGDLALVSMTFPDIGAAQNNDPYAEWPISISVLGRYHNLAIMFGRLSNFSRIMNVENIDIAASGVQTDYTITANFIAKTFVYIEPKETAPAAKPGGAKPAKKDAAE